MSIAVVVMETHPTFRVPKADINRTISSNSTVNNKIYMYKTTDLHPILVYADGTCIAIFTLDLLTRLIISPSKLKFFKSFFNIIDFLCVIPLLIVYILQSVKEDLWGSGEFFVIIAYLSLSSVLRVFRLFKLARHYRGLRILQLAVRSSLKELMLLFLLISMGMLVFSTLIYFAEFNQKSDDFPNIPIGFWWSIITMTTVGYGDKHPTEGLGYLVGGICAISGMLITGLPIPIIASNFNHYYNYARLTAKMAAKPLPERVWQGVASRAHTAVSQRTMVTLGRREEDLDGPGSRSPTPSINSRCSHLTVNSSCSSLLNKSTARLSSIGVTSPDRGPGGRSPIVHPSVIKTGVENQSPAAGDQSAMMELGEHSTMGRLSVTGRGSSLDRLGYRRNCTSSGHGHRSGRTLSDSNSPRSRTKPTMVANGNNTNHLSVPTLSISDV